MINPEAFLFIDIVKGALLRRMSREVMNILSDTFLKPERMAASVTLYERVGEDFVEYIKSLHAVKTPGFLFVMAGNAVEIFQDNLNSCWCFAYDGKVDKPINWLSANIKRGSSNVR